MTKHTRSSKKSLEKLLLIAVFLVMLALTVACFAFQLTQLLRGESPQLLGAVGRLVGVLLLELLAILGLLCLYIWRNSRLADACVREQLRLGEERFRVAIESSDNLVFEYDYRSKLYLDFANSEKILGKTKDQINADLAYTRGMAEAERIAEFTRYFYHEDDFDQVMAATEQEIQNGRVAYETRLRTGDDSYIWCRVIRTLLYDEAGLPYRVLGYMGNIDTLKRQSELFRIRAEKDALTGFYNKEAAVSLIGDELENDSHTPHALFVMDIDNFKTVNDTMGHMAGDAVIAETAERIRALFRSGDILGRVGGDEFVVLISGVTETELIARKAQEIIDSFNTMSVNAGNVFNISISIGIEVCAGGEPCVYKNVFVRADKALYEAKRTGKNRYIFYSEALLQGGCYTCNEAGGGLERS